MRRLARLLAFTLVFVAGCERAGADASTSNPEPGTGEDVVAEPAPPVDAFEISIINRCPEKWRYYVVAAAEASSGGTAAESKVVPQDQYVFLEPGVPTKQVLGPGDVIWLVNRKGESTATGFQTKAEGQGGRVEVNPDCEGVKRLRMAPPGA